MSSYEKRRPRAQRSRTGPGGVVLVADFHGDLERALGEFKRASAPTMAEWRRRQFFAPKPTRAARRRRGLVLEKRKARFEEAPA